MIFDHILNTHGHDKLEINLNKLKMNKKET